MPENTIFQGMNIVIKHFNTENNKNQLKKRKFQKKEIMQYLNVTIAYNYKIKKSEHKKKTINTNNVRN